jgi:hypothetical protein
LFSSVASLLESWVTRRKPAHTQRAYREDVMAFVKFMEIAWPDQAMALFSVSVRGVLAFPASRPARGNVRFPPRVPGNSSGCLAANPPSTMRSRHLENFFVVRDSPRHRLPV